MKNTFYKINLDPYLPPTLTSNPVKFFENQILPIHLVICFSTITRFFSSLFSFLPKKENTYGN